jgi:hypothetical protein
MALKGAGRHGMDWKELTNRLSLPKIFAVAALCSPRMAQSLRIFFGQFLDILSGNSGRRYRVETGT